MRVRITPGARYSVIRLFSGMEFVKSEWRPVPAQYEADAIKSGWLEVEPIPVAEPTPEPEPVEAEPLPLPINAVVIEDITWEEIIAEPEPDPEPEPEPVKKAKKSKGGK